MADTLPRVVDVQLAEALAHLPAVLITGARAIGKTTTASAFANTVFDLSHPDVLREVKARPDLLIEAEPPVLIDEWQRYPASMDIVKTAVDRDFTAGRFMLTGTPSFAPDPDIHSGAGRLVKLPMWPMSMAERRLATPVVSLADLFRGSATHVEATTNVTFYDYANLLVRSGFPAIWLAGQQQVGGQKVWRSLLDLYVAQLCEREVAVMSQRETMSAALIRRWLRSYAAVVGTDARFDTIRDAAHDGEGDPPARSSTSNYRTVLEKLGVVDEQPAWDHPFVTIKRKKTSALHHLVDPALAANLLHGTWLDELSAFQASSSSELERSFIGKLFQSLVTQSVRVYATACGADVFWLGTRNNTAGEQREVDIVVVNGDGRVVAIEVKARGNVTSRDCRHLNWLRSKLGARWADGVVLYTGSEAYRRHQDDIAVVPAALLGP